MHLLLRYCGKHLIGVCCACVGTFLDHWYLLRYWRILSIGRYVCVWQVFSSVSVCVCEYLSGDAVCVNTLDRCLRIACVNTVDRCLSAYCNTLNPGVCSTGEYSRSVSVLHYCEYCQNRVDTYCCVIWILSVGVCVRVNTLDRRRWLLLRGRGSIFNRCCLYCVCEPLSIGECCIAAWSHSRHVCIARVNILNRCLCCVWIFSIVFVWFEDHSIGAYYCVWIFSIDVCVCEYSRSVCVRVNTRVLHVCNIFYSRYVFSPLSLTVHAAQSHLHVLPEPYSTYIHTYIYRPTRTPYVHHHIHSLIFSTGIAAVCVSVGWLAGFLASVFLSSRTRLKRAFQEFVLYTFA
jgi:hypothetical protein